MKYWLQLKTLLIEISLTKSILLDVFFSISIHAERSQACSYAEMKKGFNLEMIHFQWQIV